MSTSTAPLPSDLSIGAVQNRVPARALVEQFLGVGPRFHRVAVAGTADANHPHLRAAQHARVDQQCVDLVESAQTFRPQRQHSMPVGQAPSERGCERLMCGAHRLWRSRQRRIRGHSDVAGDAPGQADTDHLHPRHAFPVTFDRPGRWRNRARRTVHLRFIGMPGQLRLIAGPGPRRGSALGGLESLHRQVHRQLHR